MRKHGEGEGLFEKNALGFSDHPAFRATLPGWERGILSMLKCAPLRPSRE